MRKPLEGEVQNESPPADVRERGEGGAKRGRCDTSHQSSEITGKVTRSLRARTTMLPLCARPARAGGPIRERSDGRTPAPHETYLVRRAT
jgi:hypothetical protein